MTVLRRSWLLLPFLAACVSRPPLRTSFPPLRYDYLLKLQLNVASVDLAPPPPPGPLAGQNPAPPIDTLAAMARDRILATGRSGRAVFNIDQAEIARSRGGLDGVLAVRLDIVGADGNRAGYAEARVTRSYAGDLYDLPGTLYDMTSAMMGDMNVEFEFQVRRSLKAWLQETGTAPPPPPVEQQPLSPPGGTAGARPPA